MIQNSNIQIIIIYYINININKILYKLPKIQLNIIFIFSMVILELYLVLTTYNNVIFDV